MYHPTAEQAEIDRKKAYETGVPHGYVPPGDKYKDLPTITLTVLSDLVGASARGLEFTTAPCVPVSSHTSHPC